jgi:hypothetical protein
MPIMLSDTRRLVQRACMKLAVTQRGFADLVDTSYRTAQRMLTGQAFAGESQLRALAGHVHPKDPQLAAELAAAAGTTLVDLGIVPAPPPPPPPQPVIVVQPAPPPPPRLRPPPAALIDSVVCAAAEAQKVMPDEIRGSLLAAFARAEQLELTTAEAAFALRSVLQPERSEEPVAPAVTPAEAVRPRGRGTGKARGV